MAGPAIGQVLRIGAVVLKWYDRWKTATDLKQAAEDMVQAQKNLEEALNSAKRGDTYVGCKPSRYRELKKMSCAELQARLKQNMDAKKTAKQGQSGVRRRQKQQKYGKMRPGSKGFITHITEIISMQCVSLDTLMAMNANGCIPDDPGAWGEVFKPPGLP